jgi:hypothetical protein
MHICTTHITHHARSSILNNLTATTGSGKPRKRLPIRLTRLCGPDPRWTRAKPKACCGSKLVRVAATPGRCSYACSSSSTPRRVISRRRWIPLAKIPRRPDQETLVVSYTPPLYLLCSLRSLFSLQSHSFHLFSIRVFHTSNCHSLVNTRRLLATSHSHHGRQTLNVFLGRRQRRKRIERPPGHPCES